MCKNNHYPDVVQNERRDNYSIRLLWKVGDPQDTPPHHILFSPALYGILRETSVMQKLASARHIVRLEKKAGLLSICFASATPSWILFPAAEFTKAVSGSTIHHCRDSFIFFLQFFLLPFHRIRKGLLMGLDSFIPELGAQIDTVKFPRDCQLDSPQSPPKIAKRV